MTLTPTPSERLARARGDLRLGLPVALRDNGRILLALAAEGILPDRLAALRALGDTHLALTDWRARTLKIRVYDGDLARVAMPRDADCRWIEAMADPADDLSHPMKGPFTSVRDGDATADRVLLRILKGAQLLPAAVVVHVEDVPDGLTCLDVGLTTACLDAEPAPRMVVSGRVPMALAQAGRVHVVRLRDGGPEHVAVEIGQPARNVPVLTRLHSACFTGDVLGSLKCDCGPQLHAALGAMGTQGSGILLYLSQEGRGIGLANKMRAYALQDQGFDTVEANHRLGFADDERDFRVGAALLKRLGFGAVRLMTNNPAKVEMLTRQGIDVVERVPLIVGRGPQNADYLDTKARKSGHLL